MSGHHHAPPTDTIAIGHDVPRVDALPKVTGEARYAGDLKFHGMLYGRALRSDRAHARIISIDTASGGVRIAETKPHATTA